MITVPPPLATASRRLISPLGTVWSWPKKYTVPAGIAFVLIGLTIYIFTPQPVIALSYAQSSHCLNRLTFLPTLHQSTTRHNLKLVFSNYWQLGSYKLAAGQVCLEPTAAPQPGSYNPTIALFGLPWLALRYQAEIPNYPTIDTAPLQQPIPVSKSLVLLMSQPDQLFDYQLVIESQTAGCHNRQSDLICPIEQLELEQGQSYPLKIEQHFASQLVKTIIEQEVQTLSPTAIVHTSIPNDQRIYDKPQALEIEFDKPVVAFKAILVNLADDQKPITLKQTIEKTKARLEWSEVLPRKTSFQLTIDQLQAEDGSSLLDPYQLKFSTSGGPQVASVNIGQSGVALGATAVITFDQPIATNQDWATILSVNPGQSVVSSSQSTVQIKLSGLPACTDFKISLDRTVANPFGIDGDSAWAYSSRTICHTVQTIGYSVKGRPIHAYTFGNGATTILYTGAIHGNEVGTKYLMDAWISELEAKARQLPAGRKIVVVPLLNPDGFAAGTRNNANNVDLNRNFDVSDWQKDITDTYGRPLPNGGGSEPMSEPETQAIASFTSRLRPRTTMSFHNVGGVVIANQASHSTALAASYSSLSGYRHATGQSSQTFDYAISGTYDDWIAEKLGLASVLVETSSRTYSQFSRNVNGLWKVASF